MHEAAQSLVGTHDFLAFTKIHGRETTVRTIHRLMWRVSTSTGYASWLRDRAFCTTWSASFRALWWKWDAGTEEVEWVRGLWHHWIAASLRKGFALSGLLIPQSMQSVIKKRYIFEYSRDVYKPPRSIPMTGRRKEAQQTPIKEKAASKYF